MAVNVSNTTTTNTFEFWRLRTNQMANLFRVKAVTTNSNTTPGSASITGTFSGGNLIEGLDSATIKYDPHWSRLIA